jgi:pimeloyl-ACP methyl ester carboxylesterase
MKTWQIVAFAVLAILALLVAAGIFWAWTPDQPRASLEARYLGSTADLREVDGVRLNVRDSGPTDAHALILLHGFGASLQTWDAWADALAATHRVIRIDLPGSGLSAPDPTGDYTDARSMQLIVALMKQLDVPRASLIGHSIGGRIAWTFAAAHPTLVDKLVLIAPDGFASPGFAYGKPPEVPASLSLMRFALPKALLRMSLEPAYHDPAMLTDALTTRYHDLLLAPGSREALLARMRQTVLVDPVPLLKTIHAPTLLLWGEEDAMIPIANAQDYLKALPDARLVVIPNSGHLPQEEAAQASLAAVRAFLD